MDIIVTHENADFDAIASTIAAQKLYPEATIVLGRRVGRVVRDFLALHKDRFKTIWSTDLKQEEVSRMIIVDVRRSSRLKEFAPLLEKVRAGELEAIVYDHHASAPDDIVGKINVVEPVGSATTLLIEEIRRREGIEVDGEEATLMAIGIYTDTGSLTYASTTARDAEAVAWLLGKGASLKMVNRYLRTSMNSDQRQVFGRLLGHVKNCEFGGVDVGVACVDLDKRISGLGEVVGQVLRLEGHAALFSLFSVKRRVILIARSQVPYLDVGKVVAALGGGGHPGAAAATLKGRTMEEVRADLLEFLRANPPHPRTVLDIMSSPVKSVSPETPLQEVRDSLREWRHTGVPVLRDNVLVGIISRRDVQAAEKGNRLHLSVASCMSHDVKSISAESTLEDAMDIMVRADIGRLPVLREGIMIGIVSRSDLLKVLYKGE